MIQGTKPDVGQQIHRLRRERGLSLRSLARESGLSLNAISRIERGESSPTVSSLHQLATALGVEIVEFFEADPENNTVVVREHQRLRTRGEGILIESLGAGLPGQRMGPFLMTLLPGAWGGKEPITHAGEEFVYCLEGEVDYQIQGEWHRLRPGDSLLFLASQPHLCRNSGLTEGKLLLVIQAPCEEVSSAQQRHLMAPLAPGIGAFTAPSDVARPDAAPGAPDRSEG
jgi:transcriptional regulator with XRE-family HTH domain